MEEQTFAARLRCVRRDQLLTQRALADRAGIHFKHVANLEQGRYEPRFSTVTKLADALGVDARWLMFGRGEMRSSAESL